ncbi:unnamed protein product [Pieris macdunnoughi]|uniref:THAP-type domain-containing protein n=1 Tax=Pieris macdunnoughi TaxID=345717 RepID=A0A821R156_9NEOP|nr:unnamed protein product [Pieris macdunnoughi]
MPHYKYCIVPKCTNTSSSTPEKLFFNVPRDLKVRKKWCTVMKRDDKVPLSYHTVRYCCEDHFDLEADMENYVKYKLVGGQLRLKKEVLPHKFDCQKPQKNIAERPGFKKRQDIEYLKRVLSKNVEHENLMPNPVEFIEIEDDSKNNPLSIAESVNELPESHQTGQKTKGVQISKMPRKYKRKPGVVPRNIHWTEDSLALAFEELKQKKKGKYPVLGVENERRLVAHLLKLGDAGFPPDRIVIRQLAYQFAEKAKREEKSIEDQMTATESNEPSEMDCQPTALLQLRFQCDAPLISLKEKPYSTYLSEQPSTSKQNDDALIEKVFEYIWVKPYQKQKMVKLKL